MADKYIKRRRTFGWKPFCPAGSGGGGGRSVSRLAARVTEAWCLGSVEAQ